MRLRLRRWSRGDSFSSDTAAAAGDADGKEYRRLLERETRRHGFLHSTSELNDAVVIAASIAGYLVARGAFARQQLGGGDGNAGSGGDAARVEHTLRLLGALRAGRPIRLLSRMPAIGEMLSR